MDTKLCFMISLQDVQGYYHQENKSMEYETNSENNCSENEAWKFGLT